MTGRLLIVDDERAVCWSLERAFKTAGLEVEVAGSAEEATQRLQSFEPDVALVDIRLPGKDGLSLLEHLRKAAPNAKTVVMTAHGSLTYAVGAMRAGAAEYLPKPFDLDVALATVERLLQPQASTGAAASEFDQDAVIGMGPAMQEVFKRIAIAADSEIPALITGETGVGKDLVAKAIHRHGPRRERPYVAVHLASLNESVVESELFGRARGAYTGAGEPKAGVFELASGGTLFLDEIGEAPLALQVKLLRAVEQGEIWPVGAVNPVQIDIRVLAATHRDLRVAMEEGRFRPDLYHRLNGLEIRVPPLRARLEDVPTLVRHFLTGTPYKRAELAAATVEFLQAQQWPGNVRELRHAIGQAVALARGAALLPEHFPTQAEELRAPPDEAAEVVAAVQRWATSRLAAEQRNDLFRELANRTENALLKTVVAAAQGNRALAARWLGLDRATLRKKLAAYGLAGLEE